MDRESTEKSPNSGSAVSGFGPKIKFVPFKRIRTFSIQTIFLFPGAIDMEGKNNGRPFLEYDKNTWWTQFFYDKLFNKYINLFVEGDIIWKFGGNSQTPGSVTAMPVSVFLNIYPNAKITTYVFTQVAPTIAEEFTAFYTQIGLGFKYQVTNWFELETSYTNFIVGKNSGAGQTFNLGFRFVRLKN